MKVTNIEEWSDEVSLDIGRVHIRVIKDEFDGAIDVYIYDNLKDEDNDFVDEDYKTSWTFVTEGKEEIKE